MSDRRDAERTLLIMLCGIPGSGKSTIAAELIRKLGDVEVIATDVIGRRGARYERLKRRLDERAGDRQFIVLDGTFYSRAHRDAVRALGYPVLLVYLRCPLGVCLKRNRERPSPIPDIGVIGMSRRFEPPAPEERPLLIDTDTTDPGSAVRRIQREIARRLSGEALPE